MAERIFPSGSTPTVTIRAEKNLSIRGGEPAEIRILTEDLRDLSVVESNGEWRITCEEDCALWVPVETHLIVEEAGGNASISEVAGTIDAHKVDGNLTMIHVGEVNCRRVDGNLWVDTAGRLTIEGLGGNLKGGRLSGLLSVAGVGGNVKLGAVAGVDKVRAGGNVRLGLIAVQNDLEIIAGGNARVQLPPGSGFTFEATSGGQNVTLDLNGSVRKISGSAASIRFGEGGPRLKVTAGGNVHISDYGYDEVEGERDGVEADWSEMSERIQRRIEERISRAEQRFEAGQRRAEQRVREAMEKVGGMDLSGMIGDPGGMAGWQQTPSAPWDAPVEESEPVTDAEKMLVLTMLQEKKITAEAAERLLDALAGKFD